MNSVPDYFGSLVFDDRAMKAKLPFGVYDSLRKTIDEGANLNTDVANAVADAMKDWAVEHGRYTFYPLVPAPYRYNCREARQLYSAIAGRRRHNGIFRQKPDTGRA